MVDLIRSASLTHYPMVARSLGIDPKAMLKQARLPLHCLERPDLRIGVAAVRRLLELSAEAAGVEEFGLRLAEYGISTLGPVGLVVREQATVGAAIETLARYIQIQNEAMRLEIDRRSLYTVNDPDDLLHREPLVGWFRCRAGACGPGATPARLVAPSPT